jgi:hypothetical protein
VVVGSEDVAVYSGVEVSLGQGVFVGLGVEVAGSVSLGSGVLVEASACGVTDCINPDTGGIVIPGAFWVSSAAIV